MKKIFDWTTKPITWGSYAKLCGIVFITSIVYCVEHKLFGILCRTAANTLDMKKVTALKARIFKKKPKTN